MHNTLFNALAGLAMVGALLLAGALSGTGGASLGRSASASEPSPAPVEAVEEAARGMVGETGAKPRKPSRARGSLSMPYFSFAQSLRTRG